MPGALARMPLLSALGLFLAWGLVGLKSRGKTSHARLGFCFPPYVHGCEDLGSRASICAMNLPRTPKTPWATPGSLRSFNFRDLGGKAKLVELLTGPLPRGSRLVVLQQI